MQSKSPLVTPRAAALSDISKLSQSRISRRLALQGLGVGLFTSCSDSLGPSIDAATSGAADAAVTSATAVTASASATTAASAEAWAIGGTSAMSATASYPDPFAVADAVCELTCRVTQGPCWAPTAPLRQDISEGEPGIPLRLQLRVVDADAACAPLEGAEVEIWYCNVEGVYSAADVENPSFCTGNNEHALESYFFRGRALSDATGKVTFDGCFPGWYASRSVHIHLLVRPATKAGAHDTTGAIAVSQLFFPETLTAEIFSSVEGYQERGQPDTTFEKDNVLTGVEGVSGFIVDYQRMSDGAMLAWKTIAISSSTSCGSSDMGGMGGGPMGSGMGPGGAPPPGGMPPGGGFGAAPSASVTG
jgi:protocatechuate 3,4-dioxygenase beta subunit